MNYYISDPHFGHKNIACKNNGTPQGSTWESGFRMFDSVEEHDTTIMDAINNTVGYTDTLYILGDLTLNKSAAKTIELLSRINCSDVRFVIGNHDTYLNKYYNIQQKVHYSIQRSTTGPPDVIQQVLKGLSHKMIIKVADQRMILSHCPINSWDNMRRGSWHLYGHEHSPNYMHRGLSLNVCLDSIYRLTGKWNPLSHTFVTNYMAGRTIQLAPGSLH